LDIEDRAGIVATGDLFEKVEIGGRVERGVAVVVKLRRVDIDTSKNLDASSFAGGWDFRWTTASRPSAVERGILAKCGFVFVDQRGIGGPGFFLMRGYVRRSQRWRAAWSARASTCCGRCTENPKCPRSFRTWPG